MPDFKKIWLQRFDGWYWLALPVLTFMALMQVATWLGLQPDPTFGVRALRTAIGLFGLALGFTGAVRIARAQKKLLEVARHFASGRLEARAPSHWHGLTGELAEQLNTLGKMMTQYRDHQDNMVMQTTSRLRQDQERLSELNAELRRALRESQNAARAQSELFSNLSHELRTPLTAILGYADLLRRSGNLSIEQGEHIDTLDRSARGMLSMINDLLDWSRIEAGRLKLNEESFDVLETVEDTTALLAPLAYNKRLELIRIFYHDVPRRLSGDAQRVRQILTNLVSNAIKFTDTGEVVLRVMRERDDDARVWLRFSVADSGIGISPEQLARLFKPFQQAGTSAGGSGLGLSICRKLAELMGGKVEVDSVADGGSTFSVTLPFRLAEAPAAAASPDTRLHERSAWLYEPHPIARLALMHWLEFWGLRVRSFETLETLQSTLAGIAPNLRPGVVITGLSAEAALSPEALAFYAYCSAQKLSLLVLLASSSLDLRDRVLKAGASACLPKAAGHARLQTELMKLSGADLPRSEPLAGKFVLIADNNLPNRHYIATLCSELGLDISEAADGAQALQLWQELRPEFVLLDARMPLLDGAGCARAMRQAERAGQHCRIVAASAHLEPEERSAFLAAGADAILIKPFTTEQLLHALLPNRQEAPPTVAEVLTTDPEMLQLLQEELPKQYAELREALDREDSAAARDAAHQLHGTAAFYHLAELKKSCAALERKLAAATAPQLLEADIQSIETILQHTLQSLGSRKTA